MIKTIIFLVGLLYTMVSYGQNDSVYYEPDLVTIDGVIETHIFPGRPNYDDIALGDEIEDGFYLRLDKKIDVADIGFGWGAEKDVGVVQMTNISARSLAQLKNGDHVRLTGSLFQGHTGHHHTRVLVWVKDFEKLPINDGKGMVKAVVKLHVHESIVD